MFGSRRNALSGVEKNPSSRALKESSGKDVPRRERLWGRCVLRDWTQDNDIMSSYADTANLGYTELSMHFLETDPSGRIKIRVCPGVYALNYSIHCCVKGVIAKWQGFVSCLK